MSKIKKIFFSSIKSILALTAILTVVLFFYAGFIYNPPSIENEILKKQTLEKEETLKEEEQKFEKKLSETLEKKKIKKKLPKIPIEDGLFATIGNKAITKSDIINQIKLILILTNQSYSDDQKDRLHQMAVKQIIKISVKQIEIDKNTFLEFNKQDLNNELIRTAGKLNMDLPTFKNIFKTNDLDFSIFENQVKTDLLWNSLIFQLYKNRISIDLDEINEQLKLIQTKKEVVEYLISEIVIKAVEKNKIETAINDLKEKVKINGFENVALDLSIADSAARGGDLGWLNENIISKKLISIISNTPVGGISQPILLPNGILVFKVRDKRKIKKEINLEEAKNTLVNSEKERILNMHSSSHYSNLRRSITIKFF